MNLNELKIGDRVGYSRSHYETFMEKGFGVVTKINGHGHITIILCGEDNESWGQGHKVFDKHGVERKRGHSSTRLCSAESLTRRLAEVKADHAKQKAVRDLLDYIAKCKCGNGRYNIDEDSKNKIKLLAAQL